MKGHGQSGLRIHAPDKALECEASQIHHRNARQLSVATFNVRTLADKLQLDEEPMITTTTKSQETCQSDQAHHPPVSSYTKTTIISNKLQQIVVGCEKYLMDIVSIQEHRLKTTNGTDIEFVTKDLNGWTLAHTNSSKTSHGVAILFSAKIAKLLINV